MRKCFRRLTALVLSFLLALPSSFPVAADEKKEAVRVEGTRIAEDEIPEGEDIVYFGVTELTLQEGESVFEIPLYREGNLEQEETVTIHTVDLTALYGKDYELPDEPKTEQPSGRTLLEQVYSATSSEENEENEETETDEKTSQTDTAEVLKNEAVASPSDAVIIESSFSPGSSSSLARLKSQQTGKSVREETESVESDSLSAELLNSLIPTALSTVTWSCEKKITFEKGESEQTLRIRLKDDQSSEGTETFTVVMTATTSATAYKATSLSVMIEDDEELIHSQLSFEKESYVAPGGELSLTVVREKAVYSMASAQLKGRGESGEEVLHGEIVFLPYEEKKEIDLTITEDQELYFDELNACEEGEKATCKVLATEAAGDDSGLNDLLASAPSGDKDLPDGFEAYPERGTDFTITIGKKQYTVKSDQGKATGAIIDENDWPNLEVGRFVFAADQKNGGYFSYNLKSGDDPNTWRSHYSSSSNCGYLRWYHSYIRRRGKAYAVCSKDTNELLANYYQVAIPYWEEYRSVWGGQESWFEVCLGSKKLQDTKKHKGEFKRDIYAEDSVKITGANDYLKLSLYAVDDTTGRTPYTEVMFGGVALLYRKFEVSVENPDKVPFLTVNSDGKDAVIYEIPLQMKVKCGEQSWAGGEKRNIYANLNSDDSNLVLTTEPVYVNGCYNKFGEITGYRITLDGVGEDKVTFEYPKDYVAWLDNKHNQQLKGIYTGKLDYSWQAVSSVRDKVTKDMDTIPFDAYFTAFIDDKQKTTYSDGLNGNSYYQKMTIKPVVEQTDITVAVGRPSIDKGSSNTSGAFNNSRLKAGTTCVFHAGDVLDLSVKVTDPGSYVTEGYEVAEAGTNVYDTIRTTKTLLLDPVKTKQYEIRPCITTVLNGIELKFANELSQEVLTISNQIVPQEALQDYPDLKGRYFLDINPKAKTIYERISVEPGKHYTISAVINTECPDKGMTYRCYFIPQSNSKRYSGQSYAVIAGTSPADNVVKIGVQKTEIMYLTTVNLSGVLMHSMTSIRNDALGEHESSATGYVISVGNGQTEVKDATTGEKRTVARIVSDTAGKDGKVNLTGLTVRDGDLIQALIYYGDDDGQVVDIEVDRATYQNLGKIRLKYPRYSPCVTSIAYEYAKSSNTAKVDVTDNTVRVFEDSLILTANVDTRGKNVKRLIFQSRTVNGVLKEYPAEYDPSNPGVVVLLIENMMNEFHNGERLSVRVVEERKILVNGKYITTELETPLRETGLVFYTENEQIAPKDYEVYADVSKLGVDIPLIGSMTGSTENNKLKLSRYNWPRDCGYSLVINYDAVLKEISGPSTQAERLEKFGEYTKWVRDKNDKKKGWLESKEGSLIIPESEDTGKAAVAEMAENAGNRSAADEVEKNPSKQEGSAGKGKVSEESDIAIDVLLCIVLDFIMDPVKDEYVLARAAVTIGATGKYSKSWPVTSIGIIPLYVALDGTGEFSVLFGGNKENARNALTEGDFDKYEGNVHDLLKDDDQFMPQVDISVMGKGSFGAGVYGIISARGFVDIGVEFQFLNRTNSDDYLGAVLSAGGGVGIDFVFGSFDFEIASIHEGIGTLADHTEVTMFNETKVKSANNSSLTSAAAEKIPGETEETEETEEDTELFAVTNGASDEISSHSYTYGTSDFSGFGSDSGLLGATEEEVSRQVLLSGAAERTRPELLYLDDGRVLMVFIGARQEGTGDDKACLYYSICSASGKWSAPVPVDEDGTFDSQPQMIRDGDMVYITWLDAGKKLAGNSDVGDKMASVNANLAFFNTKTEKVEKVLPLTDNAFSVTSPRLSLCDGRLYCMYMLGDMESVDTIEDLAHFSEHYNTMAWAQIDPGKQELVYTDRYVAIDHETVTDPMVLDFNFEVIDIDDRTYSVSTYTVDTDENFGTSDDVELYLRIVDITDPNCMKHEAYYPICLSGNENTKFSPLMTKLENGSDEQLYLTWVENGEDLKLLDVTMLLNAFFNTAETYDGTLPKSVKEAFRKEGVGEKPGWYKKTAEELGMENEAYEASLYYQLTYDSFPVEDSELGEKDIDFTSVSEMHMVTDGTDLYLFFTKLSPEEGDNGVELYGMRYQKGDDSEEGRKLAHGFTQPVQLTDGGMALDEISLIMNEAGEVRMASNCFEQSMGDDDQIVYGENSLVYITFATRGSVEIIEGTLNGPDVLTGGTSDMITFDVTNNGLLTAESFDIYAVVENDGKESVIYSGTCEEELYPGDEITVQLPWTLPESLKDARIKVTVSENDVDREHKSTAVCELESGPILKLDPAEAVNAADGRIRVSSNLENWGNETSDQLSLRLYRTPAQAQDGSEEDQEETLAVQEIAQLKAGEEVPVELTFTPELEDYSSMGLIMLTLEVSENGEVCDTSVMTVVQSQPKLLELENGKEQLKLTPQSSRQLSAELGPWGELAGGITYYSSDSDVVSVDDSGKLMAGKIGTAVITAYEETYGISDTITVVVTGSGDDDDDTAPVKPVRTGTWGNPVTDGVWVLGADGKWTYRTNALFRNTWGYILNPYAKSEKDKYGWFYFDAAGKMLTGWQKIGGKWYYLNPNSDGTQGMCFLNTTTPDGYRVDANGVWIEQEEQL